MQVEKKHIHIPTLDLTSERTTRRSFAFWLLVVLVLIGIDQLVKYFLFLGWPQRSLEVITSIVGIELFRNENFAFSLPMPAIYMYAIYLFVLACIFFHVGKKHRSFTVWGWTAWSLIVAGAFSNIGERVVLGWVRDFIFLFGGIFNLADLYIILGVIALIVKMETQSASQEDFFSVASRRTKSEK